MLLFVYGTLKRHQRNHRLLADQRFVRSTLTAPGFSLFDLGPFPGMVFDKTGGAVRGELYEVSDGCVDELDDFEGVPDLFTRERIELVDGTTAWAYLYARPVPLGKCPMTNDPPMTNEGSGQEWP